MAKKDYGVEGVGDKTEPLPGMLDPISQAREDKRAASQDGGKLMFKNEMKEMKDKEPKPVAKPIKKMAMGGSVGSASKRADGCAQRGKTRGKIV